MTIIIDGTTGVPVSPVTGTLAVANGGTGSTTAAAALIALSERTAASTKRRIIK